MPSTTAAGPPLVFINSTHHTVQGADAESLARRVRSQASRASNNARLATCHSRAEARRRQPGQGVFRVRAESPPPATRTSRRDQQQQEQDEQQQIITTAQRFNHEREATIALHARTLLGGAIPAAQANVAILAQFLHRFNTGAPSDRPWTGLVMEEATSSATPSPVTMALQANASALCANDLQEPEIRKHATRLYLSSIKRLQATLNGPNWHDSAVMYTCMILTLFETIQTSDPSASHAHVSGVAMLMQQKGPDSFVRGLEHRTFRYYRITIVMKCLAERQHCFLAEPDWKSIPFSGDCAPKTVLDLLLDILAEVPGVLAAVESLTKGTTGQWSMIQNAFDLVCWVRRLISDLEAWKHNCIYTYPTICDHPNLKSLDLLTLCYLGTSKTPYDPRLGEALNCYAGAQLILTRIAQRFAERSFLVSIALRPTYTLRELVAAIVLVSEKHINVGTADMISVMVTTFPLKVAEGVDEFEEPALFDEVRELLAQVNTHVARTYNIHYTVPSDTGKYTV